MDNQNQLEYKIPPESANYLGEFIVFFPEEENPKILFHSVIAEEAYKKSEEIEKELGKPPVVIRVSDSQNNMIQNILFTKV